MGWIFAQPAAQKQYDGWRSQVDRRARRRPEGKPLAQLARDLGAATSGIEIVRGGFEFRN
jgi:hypothetical protein